MSVEPSARVVLDSVAPTGQRLTTLEVVMHRFVLAEFNTHRAFSRNSASSRAIPVAKRLAQVRNDPMLPVAFPVERRGMGGHTDEVVEGTPGNTPADEWRYAARRAAEQAERLSDMGVHKSVVNRLLEPFLPHTVIVSATEWQNYFKQRCSPLAQPEIRVVSELMQQAIDNSAPQELDYDQWHTPYVQPDEGDAFWFAETAKRFSTSYAEQHPNGLRKRVSAARCARVSYLTHDGRRDVQKDLELYDKLRSADPPHWSPMEHVATPAHIGEACPGNFDGWQQLRHRS